MFLISLGFFLACSSMVFVLHVGQDGFLDNIPVFAQSLRNQLKLAVVVDVNALGVVIAYGAQ